MDDIPATTTSSQQPWCLVDVRKGKKPSRQRKAFRLELRRGFVIVQIMHPATHRFVSGAAIRSLRCHLVQSGLLGLVLLGFLPLAWSAAQPLRLHPQNPHYFEFRGRPTVIITSGEHYGALLNLDFNYTRYFQALERDGMNSTRTFAGAYCEPPDAFKITQNTLAPKANRFISPWARSDQPGYSNGGNKFDLARWDDAYFHRLRDFMTEASKRGIIVELNLFCPFYQESMWKLSPMNTANNVNTVGAVARTNVYTLDKHGGLLPFQEAMTRKIVRELKGFDNLYYEICNEPYFGGVTREWQHHIVDVIVGTEHELGVKHLISQNIANKKARVEDPHPAISIFNFHYASPPDAVAMNYGLNKVIGDNETGFRGTNDAPYRMEAWDFIVAGGALFNHLDYSFVAGHEDGTFAYPASQPGGGNPDFRKQLRFLRNVIANYDFLRMQPEPDMVKGAFPAGVTMRALHGRDKGCLAYLRTGLGATRNNPRQTAFSADELRFSFDLPKGTFKAQWLNPGTGSILKTETIDHTGGFREFSAPAFQDDIALALKPYRT